VFEEVEQLAQIGLLRGGEQPRLATEMAPGAELDRLPGTGVGTRAHASGPSAIAPALNTGRR
jgi:hypothetical protein